jgi:hypothetical protein
MVDPRTDRAPGRRGTNGPLVGGAAVPPSSAIGFVRHAQPGGSHSRSTSHQESHLPFTRTGLHHRAELFDFASGALLDSSSDRRTIGRRRPWLWSFRHPHVEIENRVTFSEPVTALGIYVALVEIVAPSGRNKPVVFESPGAPKTPRPRSLQESIAVVDRYDQAILLVDASGLVRTVGVHDDPRLVCALAQKCTFVREFERPNIPPRTRCARIVSRTYCMAMPGRQPEDEHSPVVDFVVPDDARIPHYQGGTTRFVASQHQSIARPPRRDTKPCAFVFSKGHRREHTQDEHGLRECSSEGFSCRGMGSRQRPRKARMPSPLR